MPRQTGYKQLYIEQIETMPEAARSLHVARHLHLRIAAGPTVIVHPQPRVFMPVIRKRWMHIIREIERERARTLEPRHRQQLDQEITAMRGYVFARTLPERGRHEALVVTAEELQAMRVSCLTLYVLQALPDETVLQLATRIVERGLLVWYMHEEAQGQTGSL